VAGFAGIRNCRAIGEVRERWIYRFGLCFASGLRGAETQRASDLASRTITDGVQPKSDFRRWRAYGASALIDRSRAPLDLKTIQTILVDKGRSKYRPRNMKAAQMLKSRSRDLPSTYDLTVFTLLALKIYSKGERVLRTEAVAHNIAKFHCGRLLDKFAGTVGRLKEHAEEVRADAELQRSVLYRRCTEDKTYEP